jgi:hypothetical protein
MDAFGKEETELPTFQRKKRNEQRRGEVKPTRRRQLKRRRRARMVWSAGGRGGYAGEHVCQCHTPRGKRISTTTCIASPRCSSPSPSQLTRSLPCEREEKQARGTELPSPASPFPARSLSQRRQGGSSVPPHRSQPAARVAKVDAASTVRYFSLLVEA